MAESQTTTSKDTPGNGQTGARSPRKVGEGQSPKTTVAPPREVLKKVTLGQKKRKVNWVVIGLSLVVIGLAIWYFFLRSSAAVPLVVRYAAVDRGEISKGVTATGTLQAVTT